MFVSAAVALLLCAVVPGASAEIQGVQTVKTLEPRIDFSEFPLYFVTNKGQVNGKAKFYARASRYTLWLTEEGLVFDSARIQNSEAGIPLSGGVAAGPGGLEPAKFSRDVSRLLFIGANKKPQMTALDPAKHKVNYFIGSDRSKWRCDVPTSMAVLYKTLYKNIGLKVYGLEEMIEYDWIVKPGGNPADIKFEYKNAKGTRIDKEGNLVIDTEFGELIHKKPLGYQRPRSQNALTHPAPTGHLRSSPGGGGYRHRRGEPCVRSLISSPETDRRDLIHQIHGNAATQDIASQQDFVEVTFKKLGKNTYGFSVGAYDKNRELIIDPVVLTYSTYLGGTYYDSAYDIAVDSSGYAYVTGETSSVDFPILDHFQVHRSGKDVFIAKIDATKSGSASLIYSTYLGGLNDDWGRGIAVDSSGYVYVTGSTRSWDFPVLNQYQSWQGGSDAFVVKLDTTQSGISSLVYSTYLGSSGWDNGRDIGVDGSGYVYVTGASGLNFPVINQYQANEDTFVSKLDTNLSGSACLIYSTCLGGSDIENVYGIAVDNSGHAYVTGETSSSDFPTRNQYQTDPGSNRDVYVTRIDTTKSGDESLIYSTYLGGGSNEDSRAIAIDNSGYVYITGYTNSRDFPLLDQYQDWPASYYNAFVSKLDTNLAGTSSLIYSTYLGGTSFDVGNGIAVDGSENVYVTGYTESVDFPVANYYQGTFQGGLGDAFVSKIDTAAGGPASLVYSTYLGGGARDESNGIAFDGNGGVYVCGYTWSGAFPTLNPYQQKQGKSDAFIAKLRYLYINLTSPNGGESWCMNTNRNITWDCEGMPDNLIIALKQNGAKVAVIAKNIDPASGAYSWTVGDCLTGTVTPGTGYEILIGEKVYRVRDSSDGSFTITPPAISVTSPNGGEDWTTGSGCDITWTAAGVTGNLFVVLQQNGVNAALIAKGIDPAAGSYTWTVGDCIKGTVMPGTNYKVLLIDSSRTIKDRSDGSFTISPE